jgi:two-component system, NarL family, response regulator YdfI
VIRVFVAAESAVVRAGLEALLRSNEQFEIAGASAGAAAESQADVIVLDWDRDDSEPPPEVTAPTVILYDGRDPEWARDALRLGARAILPREASREEILAAVEAAAAGLVALEPRNIEALVTASPRIAAAEPRERLTSREIEVLRMLAEGEGNKTVAWKLGISEHTVKFHVASIMSKLHAASRTEAVTIGIRRGLILL